MAGCLVDEFNEFLTGYWRMRESLLGTCGVLPDLDGILIAGWFARLLAGRVIQGREGY